MMLNAGGFEKVGGRRPGGLYRQVMTEATPKSAPTHRSLVTQDDQTSL
jgi:hypothetical protein